MHFEEKVVEKCVLTFLVTKMYDLNMPKNDKWSQKVI